MKIDLESVNSEQFRLDYKTLGSEDVVLITPSYDVKWGRHNLIYRSSVWDREGNPVSLGFKKFFNLGEGPQVIDPPVSIRDTSVIEKMDGSLLIVTKYKDKLIMRTRGTLDATQMENGYEINQMRLRHPKAFQLIQPQNTYLFEWVTPNNKIVIEYEYMELYLIGVICHIDYSYATQDSLDILAKKMCIERPKRYNFNSLEELKEKVFAWEGKEGVCIYYNNDQDVVKFKSDWYNRIHAFKSNANVDSVIDKFFQWDCPEHKHFEKLLTEHFDYECFNMIKGNIATICDAYEKVKEIVAKMEVFIYTIRKLSRKEAAQKINEVYGESGLTSYLFYLLDDKELTHTQLRKLLDKELNT